MFIAFLRFTEARSRASQYMEEHKRWLQGGFADGVFLLAGGIEPGQGGAILAHQLSQEELETRLAADPFVAEGIVQTEIIEIDPGRADPRLAFLVS